MPVFRKGSYRHKIIEGLRVLPQNDIAKFMKIFGADDGSKTVFEVVRDIPDSDLKNTLAIVERSEVKHRKRIQAAAKKYIEDVNKATPPITTAENRQAIYRAANSVLPDGDQSSKTKIVGMMNEMSHEIILGAVDDLIEQKKPKNLSWTPSPDEIERFIESMKKNSLTDLSELTYVDNPGKIGFYGKEPISNLSYEFKMARAKIADELDMLKGMTRIAGWIDDAPAIDRERFNNAKDVLYRIPAQERYLPAEVTVIPDIGAIVFRWMSGKKGVRVTFGTTNVPGLHLVEYWNNVLGQDHEEKFSELSDVTMHVLTKLLDRMYV